MSVFEKSYRAFDKFLNEISPEELDSIVNKIEARYFEGPLVRDFLCQEVNLCFSFNFQQGVESWQESVVSSPPINNSIKVNNLTPNFNLESFFVYSHHGRTS